MKACEDVGPWAGRPRAQMMKSEGGGGGCCTCGRSVGGATSRPTAGWRTADTRPRACAPYRAPVDPGAF